MDPRSRAFAELLDRLGIDLEPLQLYKLDTTPSTALPWLAEQLNVAGKAGWDWSDTDEERRSLIRNAVSLHRLKGTVEGYKTIGRITKRAELRTYISPPDLPFLSSELTAEQWAAFLAQMPQIRTYRFRSRGEHHGAIAGDSFYPAADDPADPLSLPFLSDAIQRFRERAFIWRPETGREQELVVYDRTEVANDGFSTTIESVAEPGYAYGLFYLDLSDYEAPIEWPGELSRKGHPFLVDHAPGDRLYRLEFSEPYTAIADGFSRRLIAPGFDQLRVRFDMIYERDVEVGAHFDDMFLATSSPPAQVLPLVGDRFDGPPWRLEFNLGTGPCPVITP